MTDTIHPEPHSNPRSDGFVIPPQPTRTIPEAVQACYQAALGEFMASLPHGIPEGQYALSDRSNFAFRLALEAAETCLKPVLPPHLVPETARGVALAAWCDATRQLATYEP